MQLKKANNIFMVAVFVSLFFYFHGSTVEASIIDTLKDKIQSKSSELEKVKEEIKLYQSQLDTVGGKAKVLTSDINTLISTKKKLEGDIVATEKNIKLTSLTIKQIEADIAEKEYKIAQNHAVLRKMVQNLQQESSNSLFESFLTDQSLSSIGEYLDHTEKFEEKIQDQIEDLSVLKEELADRKVGAESKKKNLSQFKTELGGKKQAVVETQSQKNKILVATKNEQSNYEKLIALKKSQQLQFEREIFQFESQLKIAIDPTKLPDIGGGVLNWPLDSVRITQYFGATVDAKKLYVSGSHNGVDFGASDGTKIKAALSGSVWATGNTDLSKGCYSYGKWVMVKHANGLSTLYAHLSVISVKEGDVLTTGDIVGFSGRTGYVTGPHLHFGVYATEGVRIQQYTNSVNCKNVTIPIADPKAYLDPMLYLPKI